MIKKNIFAPLDKEIRLNYSSVAEVARKLNVTRQWMVKFLKSLENGKGFNIRTLEKVCDGLGYEIVVRKKKTK